MSDKNSKSNSKSLSKKLAGLLVVAGLMGLAAARQYVARLSTEEKGNLIEVLKSKKLNRAIFVAMASGSHGGIGRS